MTLTYDRSYSEFVGADSESGINFPLINHPAKIKIQNSKNTAQSTYRVCFGMSEKAWKLPLACVTLHDLDPGVTAYGS